MIIKNLKNKTSGIIIPLLAYLYKQFYISKVYTLIYLKFNTI